MTQPSFTKKFFFLFTLWWKQRFMLNDSSQAGFRERHSYYQTLNGDLRKLLNHWEKEQGLTWGKSDLGIWPSVNWPRGIRYTIFWDLIFFIYKMRRSVSWPSSSEIPPFFIEKHMETSNVVLLPYVGQTHICCWTEKKHPFSKLCLWSR